jgi:hypothetical protein
LKIRKNKFAYMQKNKSYWKRIFFLFLLVLPLIAAAQDGTKQTKMQKKAEKKKQERIEKDRKADLKAKKFHYKIQEKETRKRMKKHRKHVDGYSPYKQPGFFKRLFGKKRQAGT